VKKDDLELESALNEINNNFDSNNNSVIIHDKDNISPI
jgi:hypothetical protein